MSHRTVAQAAKTRSRTSRGCLPPIPSCPNSSIGSPKRCPILYMRANVGGNGRLPVSSPTDTVSSQWAAPLSFSTTIPSFTPYGCNIPLSDGSGASVQLSTTYFSTTMAGYTSRRQAPVSLTTFRRLTRTTTVNRRCQLQSSNVRRLADQSQHRRRLTQTTNGGMPRGKDGFMLISARKDRVYGTHDDTVITP